jgi:ferredoxin
MKEVRVKVEVERSKCRGYANCLMAAPDVFSIDESDLVVLLVEHPSADQEDDVEKAVLDCPARAISVVD